MEIEEKVLSMRMNEFGFAKQKFFNDADKNTFPEKIEIVKWYTCNPMTIYSFDEHKYVQRSSFCYVIGTLIWNEHEYGWDFESCGTRYLKDSTRELNDWLIDFCEKYVVSDGHLEERGI